MSIISARKEYGGRITGTIEALSLGQKFVLFAIISLVITAIVLALGKEEVANNIAILAYYLLIVGVLNCFVEYLTKDKGKLRAIASLYILAVLLYLSKDILGVYPSVIAFALGTALAIKQSVGVRIRAFEKTSLISGIILSLLFCLSLYVRVVIPYRTVFTDSFVRFGGNDPWYNIRLVESTLHHFPHRIHFDPFLSYHPPGGAPMGLAPLFDQMLAFIIWLMGLGNPLSTLGLHGIEEIAAWYPAVLVALTVFPVYYIGKALYNRNTGLLSAALIAILPGHFLTHSLLGFTDHHAAELLFSTITMLFFIIAVKNARENEITFHSIRKKDWASLKKPVSYSLLAGIFFGCYFLAWGGAPLFIFILIIYMLVQHITDNLKGKKTEYLCIVNIPLFIIPLAMIAPMIAPVLSYRALSVLIISLLLGIVVSLFLTALSSFMIRSKIKRYWYPLLILAVGITVFVLFRLLYPSVYMTLTEASLRVFAPPKPLVITMAEAQPMNWADIWGGFTTTFFIAIAALAWIVYNIARKWRSEEVLFVVWSVTMLFISLNQNRFAFYYAVNVAILCGFLSWKIIEFVKFRVEKAEKVKTKKYFGVIFTFIAILLVVFYPPLNESISTAELGSGGPQEDWYETLSWMKENTPDIGVDYYALYPDSYTYPESAYSVMSWWDYGHWITYIAHRIPVANPFNQGLGGPYKDNSPGACVFFVAINETEANNVADALDVRYVVSAFPMADAMKSYRNLYWAMTFWANDTAGHYTVTRNEGITVFELGEKYFDTMETRLHMFDGDEVQFKGGSLGESSILLVMPFHTKPLQHYRLVHESSTYMIPHVIMNATNLDMLRWECYSGVGYADGSIVGIATNISTNQGREFMYSQIVMSNGSYEFVVPYSTGGSIEGGTNYDVLATPYIIKVGQIENEKIVWSTGKEIEIGEGEVMDGETVRVDL
jgi:dolichyl-diphosphooligosaccharide--protein glycosyltransferase